MTRSIVTGPSVLIDMGANKITNVADPASAQDVATKAYADSVGGGSGIADPGGSNDDVLQRKTGAWTHRSIAQLLVDLAAAGTTFQPLDSDLTAIAALTTTSFGRAFLALADAAAARTAIGTVIGTDVEAHDPDLTTIAGLTPTNDDVIQRKSGAWTNRTMANLIADLAALGTTFQPLDSDLTSIAALSTTSFGRGLLASADAAALRTSAGLGSLATLSTITTSEITDGTIVNADISASAAIGYSKLALASSIVTGDIVDGTIAQADLSAALITALTGQANPWTVVRKASDEGRNTTTSPTADGALVFTAGSGTTYEWELFALYKSAAGGTTPDIKYAFGEDGTLRGSMMLTGISTGDAILSFTQMGTNQTTNADGTATTVRMVRATGWHVGAGGTFSFQWAQNTSGGNDTTVLTGSILRYRAVS